MKATNKKRSKIALAICMSLCANSAISQEVADSQQELEQDVELISVTGSRIPTGSADTAMGEGGRF